MPVIPSAKHGVIQNPVISQFVPIKSAIWNYSMLHFQTHSHKQTQRKPSTGSGGGTKPKKVVQAALQDRP